MCAIIVFYVYFVLYIELLFGNVGLNGSLNFQANISWKDNSKIGVNYFYFEVTDENAVLFDLPHKYVFIIVFMYAQTRACAVAIKWDNATGAQSRMWINHKQDTWNDWREL